MENLDIDSADSRQCFSSPFTIEELRKLDLALEGVAFQQLVRMPSFSDISNDLIEDQFLAAEDFLHVVIIGFWRTFWHKGGSLPLFVSGPSHPGSKFYNVENAISRERLRELRGLASMSKPGNGLKVGIKWWSLLYSSQQYYWKMS